MTAPTLEGVVVEYRTHAVSFGWCKCIQDSATVAEVDASQVVAHLAGAVAEVVIISVVIANTAEGGLFPKNTLVITFPALQGIVAQHRARVFFAALYALGGEGVAVIAGAEVDGSQVVAHLTIGGADSVNVVALSKLTSVGIPPSLDSVVVQDSVLVTIAARDDLSGEAVTETVSAEVDGVEVVAHLVSVVANVVSVPISAARQRTRPGSRLRNHCDEGMIHVRITRRGYGGTFPRGRRIADASEQFE